VAVIGPLCKYTEGKGGGAEGIGEWENGFQKPRQLVYKMKETRPSAEGSRRERREA